MNPMLGNMLAAGGTDEISTIGVVLIGFITVFLVLLIITAILSIYPKLMGSGSKKKREAHAENAGETVAVRTTDSRQISAAAEEPFLQHGKKNGTEMNTDELIAVITAAISAYGAGKTNRTFYVTSFRRVGDRAPIWSREKRFGI